ncbi:HNH endonuclease signature motif containing protein [Cryobacterium sp.]|jgi:hypothetical protein|uniref:HNH endonuclease signature motif containing protein n=1 Tax=Cryobacterium sp. TaxID=1926290 RepID=UPI00261AB382|nr:HNH endonuclease signature motif containing protein [Cryobacterium sp.]MCU1444446.1 hypothetical protein [Cryobacterium sp.]
MANQSTIVQSFPAEEAGDSARAAGNTDTLLRAVEKVARLGESSSAYDALSDADALAGQKTLARAQHELDTRKAWMAKTLAQRSRWELGQSGLAAQQGHLSPESLIQELTGGTKAETRKLVDVGRMLAETEEVEARNDEAARGLLEALDPEDPAANPADQPVTPEPLLWHAPIARAVNDGTLSIDAAHALRKGLGDIDTVVTASVLAEALATLLAKAASLNVDQLLKEARHTRDGLDADGIRVREQKAWDDRYLRIWTLETGQVRVDGLFPPEQGEFIKATFDSLTGPRRGGVRFVAAERAAWARRVREDPRSTTQITCDGFIDLLTAGTTVNPDEMLGGRRPAVQILTHGGFSAGSAATGHGYLEGNSAPVSPETIERLTCDAGTVEISFDEFDRPLDLGRERRLFNRAQRRALAARDGGCTWPGCNRPPSFTEAHHLDHWLSDQGRTDINQGILLCRAHHLLVHNQGWKIFENDGRYWLRPPATLDPVQGPIELHGQNRLRRPG